MSGSIAKRVKPSQTGIAPKCDPIIYRKKKSTLAEYPARMPGIHEYCQLIETVFSQLQGHLHIENLGTKTDLRLVKRRMGIVTAYTLSIYMNFLLGRLHLLFS